jgi:hypothetical protein
MSWTRHHQLRKASSGVRTPVAGILTVTMLLVLVLAGRAHAGTYVINDCPSAPTSPGDSGPWTVFGGPQADKGACSGGSGDWIGPLGGSMSPAGLDGVQVAVPSGSGITIHEAKVWWSVPHQISGADTFAIASTNTGTVGTAATPLDRSTTPDDFILPSSSTWFTLADYCSNDYYGQGCTFGGGENANLQLFGAQLTLSDNNLPAGTVTGGELAGAGPVAGTQSLAFNASDADTGVRTAQLLSDGKVVAQMDYLAQCPYTSFAACPTTRSDTISWNTSSVANGSHELALRIIDAAGNTTVVDDHAITLNNPPIGVNGGLRGPHIANGQPCAGEELNLQVNRKAKPPVIPYGKPVTVRGVLHCGTVPIRNARLMIATLGGPRSAAINTSVQTALDGSFSYTLPSGPNRTLELSYTTYSDDPGPSATSTAEIMIRPRITLRIGPHRSSNGHTVHWTGTIAGGPYPGNGVGLVVEVKEGKKWRSFDQVVANRKGRFHYSYNFHATTEPTTYAFRIALPNTGAQGYPYTPGASNEVNVHVTP